MRVHPSVHGRTREQPASRFHVRRWHGAGVALWLSLQACGSAPEVEVHASLEDPRQRDTTSAARAAGQRLVRGWIDAWDRQNAQHERTHAPAVHHPPQTRDEFARLVKSLRVAPLDELRGPAERLAATPSTLWPVVAHALLARRTAPKGDYRALLALIGGDVPNRYGHFALHWKRARGERVVVSEDWFTDLLQVAPARIGGPLRQVYRDCLLTTALLRAATHSAATAERTDDVVRTLLAAAQVHEGTFRDEVGRALRAVGPAAIPTLVRATAAASLDPRKAARPEVREATYARAQLEQLGWLQPQMAVVALREDRARLAQLFEAYALAKPADAVDEILDAVDSNASVVRQAARTALDAYVTGPPPRTVTRDVRLLGGGVTRARAFMSYRQRMVLALETRLAERELGHLAPPCVPEGPPDATSGSCALRPQRLAAAYLEALDGARSQRFDAAIRNALADDDRDLGLAAIDRVLATAPDLEPVPRLANFVREAADAAAQARDFRRAGQLYRKARHLAHAISPQHAQTLEVAALKAEALAVDEPGARRMLLAGAAELAPGDTRIAAALRATRADTHTKKTLSAGAAFELALAIAALVSVWGCLLVLGAVVRRRDVPHRPNAA